MYTPREYGELLRVNPNYDWGNSLACTSEQQVALKALTIFLLGATLEELDVDRQLPAVSDDVADAEDEVELTVDRMTTDEHPLDVDDDRYVVFDHMFTVDDDNGDGEILFSKGYFSMLIMSRDYGEQGQYIFRVNPASPETVVEAEIYAGYTLDPDSLVTSSKELSALDLFLDRLLMIAIRNHSREVMSYPQITDIHPFKPTPSEGQD